MTIMASEIASVPKIVAAQVVDGLPCYVAAGERLRVLDPPCVMTCARGSSDQAATYFKYLVETQIGVPVASLGPSVCSVYGARLRGRSAAMVSVSQSGASADLVALAGAARDGGALSLAVVNDPQSPLAAVSELVLPILAGPEKAVSATKTCIASMVALAGLVAGWTGDDALLGAIRTLPARLELALACAWDVALPVLAACDNLYVVSRGPTLACAGEAALKLKETCCRHAEAYSAAELRHGPISLATSGLCALVFATRDRASQSIDESVRAMRDAGARVLVASSEESGKDVLPTVSADSVLLDPICQLLSFYGFVEQLSVSMGFNPDAPHLLSKVTMTV